MLGECNDILGTLTQRRYAKLKLSQAMIKVVAKPSRRHRCFQILIRGGDDADVDLNFPMAPQPVKRISIQNPQ